MDRVVAAAATAQLHSGRRRRIRRREKDEVRKNADQKILEFPLH